MKKRRHILTKSEAAELSEISIECVKRLEVLANEIIDELVLNKQMTSADIAEEADLSVTTVDRMLNYQTKDPKFRTVAKLAIAAGWRLSFQQRTSTVRLSKPKRKARLKVA